MSHYLLDLVDPFAPWNLFHPLDPMALSGLMDLQDEVLESGGDTVEGMVHTVEEEDKEGAVWVEDNTD